MTHAAVSGLTCGKACLRRVRRLPVPGQLAACVGQCLAPRDIVASAELPGRAVTIRAAALLGVHPRELPSLLCCEVGSMVQAGQRLAESRELFGLLRHEVRSRESGVLEAVSNITGLLRLRTPPTVRSLSAYLPGVVTALIEERGVVIEGEVTLVQGIFGMGGEHIGPLRLLVTRPEDSASVEALDESLRGAVIVVGRHVDAALLRRAHDLGVGAVVTGSASGQDVVAFAEAEINPAVTVDEGRSPTLILTEGFGDMAMSDRVFAELASLDGFDVSTNGATQIRAGVVRPEILAPLNADGPRTALHSNQALDRIRVVRGEHLGACGAIVAAPPATVEVESGVTCLVFEVRLDSGQAIVVPRPNVERL